MFALHTVQCLDCPRSDENLILFLSFQKKVTEWIGQMRMISKK